ncbi:MAG: hypothetical protein KF745_07970 [Phycisphaeraceae bacterium]|nr:hypothetical protein [Phycisphaeraceae bacterium]
MSNHADAMIESISRAVEPIDAKFGPGYAEKNPSLLAGVLIVGAIHDLSTEVSILVEILNGINGTTFKRRD